MNQCLKLKANKDSVSAALLQKANVVDVEAEVSSLKSKLSNFGDWAHDFEANVSGARSQQQQTLEMFDERMSQLQRSIDDVSSGLRAATAEAREATGHLERRLQAVGSDTALDIRALRTAHQELSDALAAERRQTQAGTLSILRRGTYFFFRW